MVINYSNAQAAGYTDTKYEHIKLKYLKDIGENPDDYVFVPVHNRPYQYGVGVEYFHYLDKRSVKKIDETDTVVTVSYEYIVCNRAVSPTATLRLKESRTGRIHYGFKDKVSVIEDKGLTEIKPSEEKKKRPYTKVDRFNRWNVGECAFFLAYGRHIMRSELLVDWVFIE